MAAAGTNGASSSRDELLQAAIAMFSTMGFEGASVREIERRAGVGRGLVAHHFGTKEALWREAVAWLMQQYHDELVKYRDVLRDVSPLERGRVILKTYVRSLSRHPELTRILMLTGNDRTGRMKWLVDEFSRARMQFFRRTIGLPTELDAATGMMNYIVDGAAAFVFTLPVECELLYGVSPTDPAFVEAFADVIADFLGPANTDPPDGVGTPATLRSAITRALAVDDRGSTLSSESRRDRTAAG